MSAQIIPFADPLDRPVICSFCKQSPPKGSTVLKNPDNSKWMCVKCMVQAKRRMEDADDSATEI
jgi:hypothetical protein